MKYVSIVWKEFVIEQHLVSECPEMRIFTTTLFAGMSERKEYKYDIPWRIGYMQALDIYNAARENHEVPSHSQQFPTKEEAIRFQATIRLQTALTRQKWTLTAGIGVTMEWLMHVLQPIILKKYIRAAQSLYVKNDPLEHTFEPLLIDPYYVGLWLGDGTSTCGNITTMDPEIVAYLDQYAETCFPGWEWHENEDSGQGKARTYSLRSTEGKLQGGPFKETAKIIKKTKRPIDDVCRERNVNPLHMRMYLLKILHNKHIPEMYFSASRQDRLRLLAGFLDTDGHLPEDRNTYEISQKSITLADNLQKLARELGFFMYRRSEMRTCSNGVTEESQIGIPVERMSIFGFHLEDIPCRLTRKQWLLHDHHTYLPEIKFSDTPLVSKIKYTRHRWTPEQDATLQIALTTHQHQWTQMLKDYANVFEGFNVACLKARVKKLKLEDPPVHRKRPKKPLQNSHNIPKKQKTEPINAVLNV